MTRALSGSSTNSSPRSELASAKDRPFTAEDDEKMLKLHHKHPQMYKTIARQMQPPRHKAEVRTRLASLSVDMGR